jgi:hypothetical protein
MAWICFLHWSHPRRSPGVDGAVAEVADDKRLPLEDSHLSQVFPLLATFSDDGECRFGVLHVAYLRASRHLIT